MGIVPTRSPRPHGRDENGRVTLGIDQGNNRLADKVRRQDNRNFGR